MPPASTPVPPRGGYGELAPRFQAWRDRSFDAADFRARLGAAVPRRAVAVDFGCGTGIVTRELGAYATLVVGVDLAPEMALRARRSIRTTADAGARFAFVVADATRPPFRDGSVDLLVSTFLLHLTDVTTTVPALRLLSAPSGAVLLMDSSTGFCDSHMSAAARLRSDLRWWIGTARRGGPGAAWRLLRLVASPAWRRGAYRHAIVSTRQAFVDACRRAYPGCRLEITPTLLALRWDGGEA